MKRINRVISFIRIHLILAKYGLNSAILLVKICSPARVARYLNPRNWWRKEPISASQAARLSLKDFKPLIKKFGEVLLNPHDHSLPEIIGQEVNKLKNKITPEANPHKTVIIEQNNLHSSPDSVSAVEPEIIKREDVGQQVKKLWNELNISQFTGEDLAHQLSSLVNKGKDLKKHFTESFHLHIAECLQEELSMFPSRNEMNNLCNDIDDLSLQVGRLQAQIKQLMSSHEIN